ncbi:hypothetical protein FB451DRAFT_1302214 [Mycena latifolia]|nr:hypothetical protein FB451DRAFT_1302214 [Mycena latifolia]
MRPAAAFLLLPLLSPHALASFIVGPVTAQASTCEPVLLQWQGGKTPWILRIIAADGSSTFENFGTLSRTSFHWTVDLEAGTDVAVQVTDSTGVTATSNSFTIQPGSTGCTLQNQFGVVLPSTTTDANGVPTSSTNDAQTSASVLQTSGGFTITSASPTDTGAVATAPASGTGDVSVFLPPASQVSGSATAIGPQQSPSSSSEASSQATTRKTNVGTVFAILIPCLICLVILALWFMRWRRRLLVSQTERSLALEAQDPAPRWFDRPEYQQGSIRPDSEIEPTEAQMQRPTLNIATSAAVAPSAGPESALTPGAETVASNSTLPLPRPLPYAQPFASSYRDSKSPAAETTATTTATSVEVQTLQSRIHALMEENAVLANLANRPASTPPPAYN